MLPILPLSTVLSIGIWKCSDNVVYFVFHYITRQWFNLSIYLPSCRDRWYIRACWNKRYRKPKVQSRMDIPWIQATLNWRLRTKTKQKTHKTENSKDRQHGSRQKITAEHRCSRRKLLIMLIMLIMLCGLYFQRFYYLNSQSFDYLIKWFQKSVVCTKLDISIFIIYGFRV